MKREFRFYLSLTWWLLNELKVQVARIGH